MTKVSDLSKMSREKYSQIQIEIDRQKLSREETLEEQSKHKEEKRSRVKSEAVGGVERN